MSHFLESYRSFYKSINKADSNFSRQVEKSNKTLHSVVLIWKITRFPICQVHIGVGGDENQLHYFPTGIADVPRVHTV